LKYKLLLLDLDGVVWRGKEILEDNVKAIRLLEDKVKIVYLTNNSTRSRSEYVERIRSCGLRVEINDVLNSGYIAAQYIISRGGGTAFVVGEPGLTEELVKAGIEVRVDARRVDYVVVGMDRFFTYNKLAKASHYIRDGAVFIATNTDSTFPIEGDVSPGAGSLVAAVSVASGHKPDFIAGKPNSWIIELIGEKHPGIKKEEILVVGDRLDTDIALGVKAGVDTLLVLTGVGSRKDVAGAKYKPTYIENTLLDFVRKTGLL